MSFILPTFSGEEPYLYEYQVNTDHAIIPETIKIIGKESLCSSVVKTIVVPEGVTSSGNLAFWAYSSTLECVIIPSSITFISDNIFAMCDKIQIVAENESYAHDYAKRLKLPFIEK